MNAYEQARADQRRNDRQDRQSQMAKETAGVFSELLDWTAGEGEEITTSDALQAAATLVAASYTAEALDRVRMEGIA